MNHFLLSFQGCYSTVVNFFVDHLHGIGFGLVLTAAVHILGIVLGCVLARNVSKAEYEEIR